MVTTWNELASRLGRNDLPEALAYNFEKLTAVELADAVCEAWSGAEYPERLLTQGVWMAMFDRADYVIDGKPADRETLPDWVTVYRGAIPDRRDGMAWTGDINTARWFANRFTGILPGDKTGRVYKLTVAREFVLARITGRNEDEYIIDTQDLDEVEWVDVTDEAAAA